MLVAGADLEGVVGTGIEAGGLNLEDVGGHRPVGCDAHIAVDDGGRLVSAKRVCGWTKAAATVGIKTLKTGEFGGGFPAVSIPKEALRFD